MSFGSLMFTPVVKALQERHGPKGFLKVIDAETLAFADYRGNKQYVSAGNLLTDHRVAMILVDYPAQARLKILGQVEVLEQENAALRARLDAAPR